MVNPPSIDNWIAANVCTGMLAHCQENIGDLLLWKIIFTVLFTYTNTLQSIIDQTQGHTLWVA